MSRAPRSRRAWRSPATCCASLEEQADPVALIIAHRALANSQFFIGDLLATRTHAEQALASYQAAQRPGLAVRFAADPYVLSEYFLAHALLRLGYPDSARPHAAKALCARASWGTC